jgi:hypothetical protein
MGWSMGWDVDQSIHDDGRTLREEHPVYHSGYPVVVHEPDARRVFVFRGDKLIPDTVYIRPDPFLVTGWESHYSDVFALESPKFYYEASFAPVVDDSWRVVGHVGWADGCDICVPGDTVQKGSKFWSILQQMRLGEWRQQLLDDADRFDRGRLPNFPFHTTPTSSPPVRKPDNCVPPAPTVKLKPTMWEEARRGPLEEKTIEEVYLNNLNYFVKGGGKALVGLSRYMIERAAKREDSWYAPYLDLKIPASSGYRFQVLVSPDGYLQAVLGIEKVRPKTRGDKIISDISEGIDIAMTVLMVIDIFPIAVVLFRLGTKIATRVTIQAIRLIVKEEAKALVDLAELEAKRILTRGAMSGPERAEAKTAWAKLKQKFWDAGSRPPSRQFSEAEAKEWNSKIAKRMSELGIPKKDQGAGLKIVPAKGEKLYPGESGAKRLNRGELGPFNPRGSERGVNYRSAPATKDMYGFQLGISVHGNVFDPWEGFDLWNDPTTTIDDRIDAIIAHEWSEYNGLSHWETVELMPETKLPIRPRARELNRYMMMMAGEPEMAFTEFTKAEWKVIVDAGKATAPFEEKIATVAAAIAKGTIK